MKHSTLFVIIAFLLGISFFGFTKSLFLVTKTARLERLSVDLRGQLQDGLGLLTQTQKLLSEKTHEREAFAEELELLEAKFARQTRRLQEQLDKASAFSSIRREVTQERVALEAEYEALNQRFLRLVLENKGLRKRLSSAKRLKRAKRMAQKRRVQRLSSRKRRVAARPRRKPKPLKDTHQRGNGGYIVKDGQLTYGSIVDIQVLPAETRRGQPVEPRQTAEGGVLVSKEAGDGRHTQGYTE